MTDEELEHRLTAVENRAQSNTHRLDELEKAPGTFGNKLWWAVIAALVSGLVAYELTMLLH